MKKIYLITLFLLSLFSFAQNGITYQAVILNPKGEELPGADNSRSPLVNQTICLRFKIIKPVAIVEYQETQLTTTDEFGMVNVVIGTGIRTGGTAANFAAVTWDGNPKNLIVEVDVEGACSNFLEISNQPFTSVPYAYYSANSGTPGAMGPAGPQGPQGVAGPTGATGQAGATGAIGATGPAGPQGIQGVAGATGPQGPIGTTGPQGVAGPTGVNGLSAYQVAVANGYNGTQIQWLASLVGAQGAQGIQGVAGPQGPVGPVSSTIGANAAFSDAITTFYGDIPNCGTYTSLAVSDNGKYVIIGCQSFSSLDSNGNTLVNGAGKVSVLKYENGTFETLGQEIIGTSLNKGIGRQVGISGDGQTIYFVGGTPNNGYIYKLINNSWVLHSTIPSIGFNKTKINITADLIISLDSSGNTTQSITFYKLVGNNWISNQFFANGILGNSELQISNDGSIIALSNYGQNLGVLPSPWAVANGRTGVFYYNGTTFTQRGNFIEGPTSKGWGYHFCLSNDGTKLGVTTSMNYVNLDQTDPCYIRTYQYNASTNLWTQYNNELVFKSNNQGGEITFFDFDSSNNYLVVAHKIESPFANEYKKSYYLLMKNLNNNWNQYGTRIEFKPTFIPDNFEFKSNIFYYVQDDKLRIKDFN